MKYVVFNKKKKKKELLYSNIDNDTSDIIKALVSHTYIGPFIASDHTCMSDGGIKNDHDMYIMRDYEGNNCIWQVCGHVTDVEDFIIPNLYYVRKVGIIFDL